MKNQQIAVNWEALDAEALTEKKVEWVYNDAVLLLNQQRETFETHAQKATALLTAGATMLAALLTFALTQSTPSTALIWALGTFAIIQAIAMAILLRMLWLRDMNYTYSSPETYYDKEELYKESYMTILFSLTREAEEIIDRHTKALRSTAHWLNVGILFFALAPAAGIVTFYCASLAAG